MERAAFDPCQVEHVGEQAVEAARFRGDAFDPVAHGGIHVLGSEHIRAVGEDGADGRPQFVRDGGEQVAEVLFPLLQEQDLLLRPRQAHGGLGGRGLVAVEADELGIHVFQLPGKALCSDLRLPTPAGQEANKAGRAEEDREVDEVLLIGDRQSSHRRDEEVGDQQEADRCRQQGGPEAAQHRDHGHHRHVDEDGLPLRRGRRQLQQDRGQCQRDDDGGQHNRDLFHGVPLDHDPSVAQMTSG